MRRGAGAPFRRDSLVTYPVAAFPRVVRGVGRAHSKVEQTYGRTHGAVSARFVGRGAPRHCQAVELERDVQASGCLSPPRHRVTSASPCAGETSRIGGAFSIAAGKT